MLFKIDLMLVVDILTIGGYSQNQKRQGLAFILVLVLALILIGKKDYTLMLLNLKILNANNLIPMLL